MNYKYLFLLVIVLPLKAQVPSLRLPAMGGVAITVPDQSNQLNLYQFCGNVAWLKTNDSTNWGHYSFINENEWGNLHRHWDAEALHLNGLVFSGQKHLSENQVFFGSVRYNRDFLGDVNYAIERTPYDLDPFVLADTTAGDFSWYGPQVFVAFSQRIFSNLYLGISLDYGIQRGLKLHKTMPEIITRSIQANLDIAYQITPTVSAGFSYRPFDRQEITDLAKQPDGSYPLSRRYRGEIKFSEHLTTTNRTSSYSGHEEQLQLAFKNKHSEAAIYAGYSYLWHELFDGTTQHIYDGYFQAESYFMNLALRTLWNKTILAMSYSFRYTEDWAKEPVADYLIYRANYIIHQGRIGFSHQFTTKPMILASEVVYESQTPDRNDLLGHQLRKGENINLEWHTGIELNTNQPWRFRAGYIYSKYSEDKIWNYFGNHQGPGFTLGFGYYGNRYQVEGAYRYKLVEKSDTGALDLSVKRENMDVYLALKQYF